MPEFLLKGIEGCADITILILSPPASHPSLPGKRVGLIPENCPLEKGPLRKADVSGISLYGMLSWGRKLADRSLQLDRGSATYSCKQMLAAGSTLARPRKGMYFVSGYTIHQKWNLKWKKKKFIQEPGTFANSKVAIFLLLSKSFTLGHCSGTTSCEWIHQGLSFLFLFAALSFGVFKKPKGKI